MQMKRSFFVSCVLVALSGAANAQTPHQPTGADAAQPTPQNSERLCADANDAAGQYRS